MRTEGERESSNVEDRRGMSGGKMAVGGGIGTVVIAIIVMLMGGDPSKLLQQAGTGQVSSQLSPAEKAEQDKQVQYVKVVMAQTETVWHEQFRKMGRKYVEPKLIIFSGSTKSACGMADAATGPFYCPGDSQLYIDLAFYKELQNRFKAPGDFAQAYVIAHEVGHHVQHLLGATTRVHEQKGRISEAQYNQLSVRLELQADFYAGIWAHHTQKSRNNLEPGDIQEALRAASAVGDDSIQKAARGHVVPDSFTHGTSAQRMRWFQKGYETGDITQGDTFSAANP